MLELLKKKRESFFKKPTATPEKFRISHSFFFLLLFLRGFVVAAAAAEEEEEAVWAPFSIPYG